MTGQVRLCWSQVSLLRATAHPRFCAGFVEPCAAESSLL